MNIVTRMLICSAMLALPGCLAACDRGGGDSGTDTRPAEARQSGGTQESATDQTGAEAATEPAVPGEPAPAVAEADAAEEDDGAEIVYANDIPVDFTFVKASYNDETDASLSRLRFAFDARVARGKDLEREIELSALEQVVSAELDFGRAILHIYPISSRPRLIDEGPHGEYGLEYDGMYQLRVTLPGDELAAIFGISTDGQMRSAPPEEWPEEFSVRSRHRPDDYNPPKYQVYRRVERGDDTEILFSVLFERMGYQTHRVVDPDGNYYDYRFPEGRLEISFGDDREEEK